MRRKTVQDKYCLHCGKAFNRTTNPSGRLESLLDYSSRKYCSRACGVEHKVGPNHPSWRGGIRRGHDWGYLRVTDGRYLHRIVMEQKLGRALHSYEHVHHLDGNPQNNDPDNLELTTNSEHRRLHSAEAPRDELGRFCA